MAVAILFKNFQMILVRTKAVRTCQICSRRPCVDTFTFPCRLMTAKTMKMVTLE